MKKTLIEKSADIIVKGNLKGQNGFGLRYDTYENGDIVSLSFFKGNAISLYKKDVKKIINYLTDIYKNMK